MFVNAYVDSHIPLNHYRDCVFIKYMYIYIYIAMIGFKTRRDQDEDLHASFTKRIISARKASLAYPLLDSLEMIFSLFII